MNKEFRLPDVGEGLTEADIVSWHVKPGDTVTINQVIVEIETAKAVVELPSPYAGTVAALLVAEGQTVDVGIPIITIDVPVAGEAPAAEEVSAAAETIRQFAAKQRGYRWQPFQPVVRPAVPTIVRNLGVWVRNPIDAFIAVEHEALGLTPRPEAGRESALSCRLCFPGSKACS